MFENFTDRARRVVVLAQEEARMLNHNYLGTEHLLLGLTREDEGVAARALQSLGVSVEAVRQQVEEIIGLGQQPPSGHIPFTPRAKKTLELAQQEARQLDHRHVGTAHILLGLVREGEGVGIQALLGVGAELKQVRQEVMQLLREDPGLQQPAPTAGIPVQATARPGVVLTASPASVLEQVGRNLTQRAQNGQLDPVVGRDKDIERVMQVLSRRAKNNPLLAGPPGIGKTSIVEGLAQKLVQGEVPATLQGRQLYAIDLDVLRDASASQADSDTRVRTLLREIRDRGDIILFISELQNLSTSAGTAGWIDAGSPLISALVRGDVQVIATTSLPDVESRLSTDPVLLRTLVPLRIAEPTIEQTITMLRGLRDRYEAHHGVSISDDALTAAAELSARLLPQWRLPGKAVDLIDEAAAQLSIRIPILAGLREREAKLVDIRREVEAAIDAQDFETAAVLRDTEKELLAEKASWEKKPKGEVTREIIAETLAGMLGRGVADIIASTPPPLFPPAAMTSDDREIWALA